MERHTRCERPSGPSRPLASRRDTFLCNSGTGARGPLGGAGVKKKKNTETAVSPWVPRQDRERPNLSQFFLIFGSTSGPPLRQVPHGPAPTLPSGPAPSVLLAAGRTLGGGPAGQSPPGRWERQGTRPAVLRRGPVGGRPALGVLSTGDGRPIPSLHPLRGLSAPPLGLLALSLFFRRRLSIQLELERAVKLDRARELSRMFFPDMMSSPKPSWWEKA